MTGRLFFFPFSFPFRVVAVVKHFNGVGLDLVVVLSLSFIQKVLSIRHNRTTSPRTPYSTHSLCVLFSFFLFSTFFSFPTTTNHTRLKHQTRRCKEIVEKNALFARSIYTLHIPSISHTRSLPPHLSFGFVPSLTFALWFTIHHHYSLNFLQRRFRRCQFTFLHSSSDHTLVWTYALLSIRIDGRHSNSFRYPLPFLRL